MIFIPDNQIQTEKWFCGKQLNHGCFSILAISSIAVKSGNKFVAILKAYFKNKILHVLLGDEKILACIEMKHFTEIECADIN